MQAKENEMDIGQPRPESNLQYSIFKADDEQSKEVIMSV
jgi:hypothetical protein